MPKSGFATPERKASVHILVYKQLVGLLPLLLFPSSLLTSLHTFLFPFPPNPFNLVSHFPYNKTKWVKDTIASVREVAQTETPLFIRH